MDEVAHVGVWHDGALFSRPLRGLNFKFSTANPTDKSVGYYQSSAWRTLISNPNCDPTDESVAIVIVC